MLTHQRGASLLEALLALFLVAFGLLAMAGMQIRTLNETRNSAARNIASQMASDLLDRMLINISYFPGTGTSALYRTGWGAAPAASVDCKVNPCNAVQLAQFDLSQWKQTLAQQLPDGDAQIFQSNTDSSQYGVLFRWRRIAARQESSGTAAVQQMFAVADEVRDGLGNSGTGVAGVTCTTGYICHLTYLRP